MESHPHAQPRGSPIMADAVPAAGAGRIFGSSSLARIALKRRRMTPSRFLANVCWPNVVEALENPQSVRSCTNAILALDALMGCIFWHLMDAGHLTASHYPRHDSTYKDELAAANGSIRSLRDAAFALKHGRLTHKPRVPRLMDDASQMTLGPNVIGFFRCCDSVGGSLVFLDLDIGSVDARTMIGDAGNFLKDLVASVDPPTIAASSSSP
jgi:hypothetical protein